jgi:hypothetical protein
LMVKTSNQGDNHDACPFRTRLQAVVSPAEIDYLVD